ncbi:hypothetical protein JST97_36185 [bacterium]|nr:hypothetical protein [bacterium]
MRNDRVEVLEGTFTTLMDGLRQAGYQDETVNGERPQWERRAGCSLLILFASCFYGGFISLVQAATGRDFLARFGPGMALLAWLWLWNSLRVWSSQKAKMYGTLDLDDHKLRSVTRWLDALEVDLDPEATQRLELDLKITKEEVFSPGQLVCEPKPWLKADLRLQGGRKLQFSVSRGFKRKTRNKRRGFKVRGRMWDIIDISATPLPPLRETCAPPFGLHLLQSKYNPERQQRQMRLTTDRALIAQYGSESFPIEQLVNERRLLQALIYFFAARTQPPTELLGTTQL